MAEYFSNDMVSEEGALTRLGDTLQDSGKRMDYLANFLPGIYDVQTAVMVGIGGTLKVTDLLIGGEFTKAAKVAVKTGAESATAAASGMTLGVANIASRVFTGKGVIDHAGNITAGLLDIGQGGKAVASHTAGIGGEEAFMAAQPRVPGRWESQVMAQRGGARQPVYLPPEQAAAWGGRIQDARAMAAMQQGQLGAT